MGARAGDGEGVSLAPPPRPEVGASETSRPSSGSVPSCESPYRNPEPTPFAVPVVLAKLTVIVWSLARAGAAVAAMAATTAAALRMMSVRLVRTCHHGRSAG